MSNEELALEAGATLALCLLVGVLAVVASDAAARWLPLPAVVLEILGGILVGPDVLGLAQDNVIVSAFSEVGLTMLIFLAGYEIQMSRVAGAPLRSAVVGWVGSLVVGLGAGITLVKLAWPEDDVTQGVIIGLLFTTTALGTVLPILRDSGDLETRFGTFILAAGALGEFGPILGIALLLSGETALHTTVVLILFGVIAAVLMVAASRPRSERLQRLLSRTLRTSGQLGVRVLMFVLLLLTLIAAELDLDVLLGAFTAGLVARLYFTGQAEEVQEETVQRLEGIGFGFLVPIFFVVSGIRFDLDSLVSEPSAVLLIPIALGLFLLVRGVPAYVALRGALAGRDRVAAAVYTSTALPLIVVITGIGVSEGELTETTAAALVAAGMLSVLIFPLTATRLRGVSRPVSDGGWSDTSDAL